LRTREPRVAKPFFILVAHNLLRVMGHVVTLELSPRGGRVRSHVTRGSAEALSCGEAGSGAKRHMVALELTSTVRRGSELRDTW
jgi:hypothetical protein